MELFTRFEQLTRLIDGLNREATEHPDLPYIRLQEYSHYCAVKTFTRDYACRLRLPREEEEALLAFFYRDTLALQGSIGPYDLYAFTFYYLRGMTYRTGNLDTPDDCVPKLDMDCVAAYRAAREKEWRGEALTEKEGAILRSVVDKALDQLKKRS